jgi:sulfatase modifying factor 1
MANFDLVNLALKATCPGNEIILDDKGLPSVMVRIPKFKISDVIDGGSDSTHPAFIVNGIEVPEIYISKFQNVVHNGRAYSLPGEDPRTSITFDTARQPVRSKGPRLASYDACGMGGHCSVVPKEQPHAKRE